MKLKKKIIVNTAPSNITGEIHWSCDAQFEYFYYNYFKNIEIKGLSTFLPPGFIFLKFDSIIYTIHL